MRGRAHELQPRAAHEPDAIEIISVRCGQDQPGAKTENADGSRNQPRQRNQGSIHSEAG